MNGLSRELGGAVGIAVLGSVLSTFCRSHLQLPGAPANVVVAARSSLAVAAGGGPVLDHARTAFVVGMQDASLCGVSVVLLAALATGLLLHQVRATAKR